MRACDAVSVANPSVCLAVLWFSTEQQTAARLLHLTPIHVVWRKRLHMDVRHAAFSAVLPLAMSIGVVAPARAQAGAGGVAGTGNTKTTGRAPAARPPTK